MMGDEIGTKIIASKYFYRYTMSIILLIAGICAILYGLYFDETNTINLGYSLFMTSFITFIILHFVINRMSSSSDYDELRDSEEQKGTPSVSTIFGSNVYETPYFSCNSCGGNKFDVQSDDSGACSNCSKVYSKIDITTEAKLLGRRNKSGKIE